MVILIETCKILYIVFEKKTNINYSINFNFLSRKYDAVQNIMTVFTDVHFILKFLKNSC